MSAWETDWQAAEREQEAYFSEAQMYDDEAVRETLAALELADDARRLHE